MSTFSQMFPPEPQFTESNLPDLSGRVFIVTGAASGVGLELAKILYSKNGTIYVAARSSDRAKVGVDTVQSAVRGSRGSVNPMILDLANLATIRSAVHDFQFKESRLDVLFLNGAVMTPPAGSKSVDGYDLELATNCLGGFLLARLLHPTLKATASAPQTAHNGVRVVWVCSLFNINTPKGGMRFDSAGNPAQLKAMENYMQTKVGGYFLACELAEDQATDGIIHVSLHPGLMKTELQRHIPAPLRFAMGKVFKGPKYGAYTELYAGLSPDVKTGAFYVPWGRPGSPPSHLEASLKGQGSEKSISTRFYEWCERETSRFI
ncbi:hypothetical protein BCR34DRAFT_550569 [Clohesyomyces aquaticus]|uniref:Short-chain dehydrogenase n=1 Tax=Clohesyomyces aquaticus TaxID=1231657 RepID=A0A1Y1Y7A8_9PLEO|nr:hypothetical protein BCR34DRAFT_550569 [Clohesyomyces aquaticus]